MSQVILQPPGVDACAFLLLPPALQQVGATSWQEQDNPGKTQSQVPPGEQVGGQGHREVLCREKASPAPTVRWVRGAKPVTLGVLAERMRSTNGVLSKAGMQGVISCKSRVTDSFFGGAPINAQAVSAGIFASQLRSLLTAGNLPPRCEA